MLENQVGGQDYAAVNLGGGTYLDKVEGFYLARESREKFRRMSFHFRILRDVNYISEYFTINARYSGRRQPGSFQD